MSNRMALISMICLCLVIVACAPQVDTLSEHEVADIAWQAFEPNTSSHNRAAWEIVDARLVTGQDVQDQFEGGPGCGPGPQLPENATLADDGSFWYVQFKRRPATPLPEPTELYSPTSPPLVPEPFIYEAYFLVDSATGEIVARRINCVVY